jgi:DNA-binding IclR family transcriptional regulator
MNSAYLLATKRLQDVLDSSIYWLTNADIEAFLGVSGSTRRRDTAVLVELGLIANKEKREGYNLGEISAFWEFRQLQKLTDRDEAIAQINNLMEMISNEYQRQTAA